MKNNGFSLIEIIIAITIVAIASALVVPRLRRSGIPAHQKFLHELNNLTRIAQLNALMTNKLHKIFFDFKKNRALIEVDSGKTDSAGKLIFTPLVIMQTKTGFVLSDKIEIDRFVIKGRDQMQETENVVYTDAHFFIASDGLAQEVTIGISESDKKRRFDLTINPFTAQFDLV